MAEEDSFIGPNYSYHSKIKNPSKLGVTPTGNLSTIVTNVKGLVNYAEVLITGDSIATDYIGPGDLLNGNTIRTGPLGPKFFIQTGGTCINDEGKEVTRSAYVNNVPDGTLPIISSMMDIKLNSFKGLIPGVLSNVTHINPLNLLNVFTNTNECKKVKLETIDENDKREYKERYLLTSDIENIDPCWFPCDKSGKRYNPDYKNGAKYCDLNCKDDSTQNLSDFYHATNEPFTNIVDLSNLIDKSKLPDNFYIQLYFFCLALLMIYFVIKMIQKK